MKVVVSQTELINLMGKVLSIVTNKPAIPVLSNILMEATDDQLIFSSTDLITSIQCFLEAKVIEKGAIALPGKKFYQLIRELTSPQIKISNVENRAEIISGSSIFKINGIPKNDFPTVLELQGNAQIDIPTSSLKEILSKTVFAAARDDNRYMLNSVFLRIENKTATFISTDGKRLAKVTTKINLDPSFQGCYTIPLKAAEEMIRILDESNDKTTLGFLHDKIFLEHGNLILATKLLSGGYPDVEKVIPEKSNFIISLHREELISLLRQISLFITEEKNSTKFIFQKGELELVANKSEIGEGKVSMPVDYNGDKLEIAFNPLFFLDILKRIKDETVNFEISDSFNPGVIKDSTFAIFVIMPMRLDNIKKPDMDFDDSKSPAFT